MNEEDAGTVHRAFHHLQSESPTTLLAVVRFGVLTKFMGSGKLVLCSKTCFV
jgi:hypothetical protein